MRCGRTARIAFSPNSAEISDTTFSRRCSRQRWPSCVRVNGDNLELQAVVTVYIVQRRICLRRHCSSYLRPKLQRLPFCDRRASSGHKYPLFSGSQRQENQRQATMFSFAYASTGTSYGCGCEDCDSVGPLASRPLSSEEVSAAKAVSLGSGVSAVAWTLAGTISVDIVRRSAFVFAP